jgi:hypothetical protein
MTTAWAAEIADAATGAAEPQIAFVLVERLLDWPFLLFVILAAAIIVFRDPLKQALRSGGVTVEWGDRKLTVGEAVQVIDDDLKETLDDFRTSMERIREAEGKIETLNAAVAELQSKAEGAPSVGIESPRTEPAAPQGRERLWRTLEGSLSDARYRWRSTERLAIIAGVSQDEVREILREHPDEVVISRGKSGREIAGLRSRVR